MRGGIVLALFLIAAAFPRAQEVTSEYQVKAVFLFNFMKFVEWPASAPAGPLTICVAGRNPLGTFLDETIRGETAAGRPIVSRVILEPEPGCHLVFVPRGAATSAYLRASRDLPVLTVGEIPSFLEMGGIINFVLEEAPVKDEGTVRFEISQQAAERVQLRISSRLLQLARMQNGPGEVQ
jgi:hypothetical protein